MAMLELGEHRLWLLPRCLQPAGTSLMMEATLATSLSQPCSPPSGYLPTSFEGEKSKKVSKAM